MASDLAPQLPQTCLPSWSVADLPEPAPITWRHWTRFIGPGLVMMGIQIGGGEWLFGPEVTAKYGGGLMWIATVAIVLQMFYNIEAGRYALYCGEPVFTGFMRTRPGPLFWMGLILLLNVVSFIPGLSTHAASMIAALILDRPPGEGDRLLVTGLAYVMLLAVTMPVLFGGKVYNTLQLVMTTKVVVVLGFCLAAGVLCVSPQNWASIFTGFLKFGTFPAVDAAGRDTTVNVFQSLLTDGVLPAIALGNIAVLGGFAGYAGGGGLSNAAYSNFVRDKGWGMGQVVGAIPSALGGRNVTLSHLGSVFPLTPENLRRWKGWWRYLLTDQIILWGPGCVMGMALPALLSMQFAAHTTITKEQLGLSQSLITADGIRHSTQFAPALANLLWIATILVGLVVMLPSQMSVVDDVPRRWTDILWSGSRRVRESLKGNQVRWIYYSILAGYVLWSLVGVWVFKTPRTMTLIISNFNNLAIGGTAVHLWWINRTLLPEPLRPKWYHQCGVLLCGAFYLGMAGLVFVNTLWPAIAGWFSA